MHAAYVIEKLGLSPHPEGGFFRETYRSAERIDADTLPDRYDGSRSFSTAIYFLLTGETFSSFHRLKSDEIWHYYAGDPVHLHLLFPDGRHEEIVVGPDLPSGQRPQALIPAGSWFAAGVTNAEGYVLIGCTVAPGFEFVDFELAPRETLLHLFPQHHSLIVKFTR